MSKPIVFYESHYVFIFVMFVHRSSSFVHGKGKLELSEQLGNQKKSRTNVQTWRQGEAEGNQGRRGKPRERPRWGRGNRGRPKTQSAHNFTKKKT